MNDIHFNLKNIHPTWLGLVKKALQKMDQSYLKQLFEDRNWLPGITQIFSAFSLSLNKTQYVLLGESPYPREQSANGYAFWDAKITHLWSQTGLNKSVNRATSLRHFIKMLLIAEALLPLKHPTQANIAIIDKKPLVQTNMELFHNLLSSGFLLLNATLVFRKGKVKYDAKAWQPFLNSILSQLAHKRPFVKLILLGKIAQNLQPLLFNFKTAPLMAEHPFNHSFIQNSLIIHFFRPFRLLLKQ